MQNALDDETAARLSEARIRESEYGLQMSVDKNETGNWEQDVASTDND